MKIKITLWCMGCRMDAVLTGMKTILILFYIFIKALEWIGALSIKSYILQGIFFFFFSKATRLNSGHKMTSKQCWKQMCCYPSFVVLFIEHRQNRFKIILKGLGTWGMVIRNGFKSAASLGLLRESICSLMFWSQTSTSPLYRWKS